MKNFLMKSRSDRYLIWAVLPMKASKFLHDGERYFSAMSKMILMREISWHLILPSMLSTISQITCPLNIQSFTLCSQIATKSVCYFSRFLLTRRECIRPDSMKRRLGSKIQIMFPVGIAYKGSFPSNQLHHSCIAHPNCSPSAKYWWSIVQPGLSLMENTSNPNGDCSLICRYRVYYQNSP